MYDFTRVKVGDRVQDNQTLQEGTVTDIQMVGQWAVLITVLLVTGQKIEIQTLQKAASLGAQYLTREQLSTYPRQTLQAGQSVEIDSSSGDAANWRTTSSATDEVSKAIYSSTGYQLPKPESYPEGMARFRAHLEEDILKNGTGSSYNDRRLLEGVTQLVAKDYDGNKITKKVEEILKDTNLSESKMKTALVKVIQEEVSDLDLGQAHRIASHIINIQASTQGSNLRAFNVQRTITALPGSRPNALAVERGTADVIDAAAKKVQVGASILVPGALQPDQVITGSVKEKLTQLIPKEYSLETKAKAKSIIEAYNQLRFRQGVYESIGGTEKYVEEIRKAASSAREGLARATTSRERNYYRERLDDILYHTSSEVGVDEGLYQAESRLKRRIDKSFSRLSYKASELLKNDLETFAYLDQQGFWKFVMAGFPEGRIADIPDLAWNEYPDPFYKINSSGGRTPKLEYLDLKSRIQQGVRQSESSRHKTEVARVSNISNIGDPKRIGALIGEIEGAFRGADSNELLGKVGELATHFDYYQAGLGDPLRNLSLLPNDRRSIGTLKATVAKFNINRAALYRKERGRIDNILAEEGGTLEDLVSQGRVAPWLDLTSDYQRRLMLAGFDPDDVYNLAGDDAIETQLLGKEYRARQAAEHALMEQQFALNTKTGGMSNRAAVQRLETLRLMGYGTGMAVTIGGDIPAEIKGIHGINANGVIEFLATPSKAFIANPDEFAIVLDMDADLGALTSAADLLSDPDPIVKSPTFLKRAREVRRLQEKAAKAKSSRRYLDATKRIDEIISLTQGTGNLLGDDLESVLEEKSNLEKLVSGIDVAANKVKKLANDLYLESRGGTEKQRKLKPFEGIVFGNKTYLRQRTIKGKTEEVDWFAELLDDAERAINEKTEMKNWSLKGTLRAQLSDIGRMVDEDVRERMQEFALTFMEKAQTITNLYGHADAHSAFLTLVEGFVGTTRKRRGSDLLNGPSLNDFVDNLVDASAAGALDKIDPYDIPGRNNVMHNLLRLQGMSEEDIEDRLVTYSLGYVDTQDLIRSNISGKNRILLHMPNVSNITNNVVDFHLSRVDTKTLYGIEFSGLEELTNFSDAVLTNPLDETNKKIIRDIESKRRHLKNQFFSQTDLNNEILPLTYQVGLEGTEEMTPALARIVRGQAVPEMYKHVGGGILRGVGSSLIFRGTDERMLEDAFETPIPEYMINKIDDNFSRIVARNQAVLSWRVAEHSVSPAKGGIYEIAGRQMSTNTSQDVFHKQIAKIQQLVRDPSSAKIVVLDLESAARGTSYRDEEKVAKAKLLLKKEFGRDPTESELAQSLGTDLEGLQEIYANKLPVMDEVFEGTKYSARINDLPKGTDSIDNMLWNSGIVSGRINGEEFVEDTKKSLNATLRSRYAQGEAKAGEILSERQLLARTYQGLLDAVKGEEDVVLFSHNTSFDLPLLQKLSARYSDKDTEIKSLNDLITEILSGTHKNITYVDSLKLHTLAYPEVGKHDLESIGKRVGDIPPSGAETHRGLEDSRLAARRAVADSINAMKSDSNFASALNQLTTEEIKAMQPIDLKTSLAYNTMGDDGNLHPKYFYKMTGSDRGRVVTFDSLVQDPFQEANNRFQLVVNEYGLRDVKTQGGKTEQMLVDLGLFAPGREEITHRAHVQLNEYVPVSELAQAGESVDDAATRLLRLKEIDLAQRRARGFRMSPGTATKENMRQLILGHLDNLTVGIEDEVSKKNMMGQALMQIVPYLEDTSLNLEGIASQEIRAIAESMREANKEGALDSAMGWVIGHGFGDQRLRRQVGLTNEFLQNTWQGQLALYVDEKISEAAGGVAYPAVDLAAVHKGIWEDIEKEIPVPKRESGEILPLGRQLSIAMPEDRGLGKLSFNLDNTKAFAADFDRATGRVIDKFTDEQVDAYLGDKLTPNQLALFKSTQGKTGRMYLTGKGLPSAPIERELREEVWTNEIYKTLMEEKEFNRHIGLAGDTQAFVELTSNAGKLLSALKEGRLTADIYERTLDEPQGDYLAGNLDNELLEQFKGKVATKLGEFDSLIGKAKEERVSRALSLGMTPDMAEVFTETGAANLYDVSKPVTRFGIATEEELTFKREMASGQYTEEEARERARKITNSKVLTALEGSSRYAHEGTARINVTDEFMKEAEERLGMENLTIEEGMTALDLLHSLTGMDEEGRMDILAKQTEGVRSFLQRNKEYYNLDTKVDSKDLHKYMVWQAAADGTLSEDVLSNMPYHDGESLVKDHFKTTQGLRNHLAALGLDPDVMDYNISETVDLSHAGILRKSLFTDETQEEVAEIVGKTFRPQEESKFARQRELALAASQGLWGLVKGNPRVGAAIGGVAAMGAMFATKPILSNPEEDESPQQRFADSTHLNKIPKHSRMMASIDGFIDNPDRDKAINSLVESTKQALQSQTNTQINYSTYKQSGYQQGYSKRDREDIAAQLMKPGRPLRQ